MSREEYNSALELIETTRFLVKLKEEILIILVLIKETQMSISSDLTTSVLNLQNAIALVVSNGSGSNVDATAVINATTAINDATATLNKLSSTVPLPTQAQIDAFSALVNPTPTADQISRFSTNNLTAAEKTSFGLSL